MSWTPDSWRARPIAQQPAYEDDDALRAARAELAALPPLVDRGEVDTLRTRLAAAGRGEAFLLQGGDCAERFADCNRTAIEAKLKMLLQMSLVLTWGARLPVVRVGRLAGQYAKPRSCDTETVDGAELPSYRGDLVHGIRPDSAARRPDPTRMVRAGHLAAATLNYTRALLQGGFADLHHPDHWDFAFVRAAANRAEYEDMVQRILDALDFVESTGVRGAEALRTVEFYSSHEGLVLDYEEAHTETVDGEWYNLGAHFLWIGDRTRQRESAHVEYFRGIENPIGLKVGPGMNPAELPPLLETLEPANREGRITLITRLGSDRVREALPPLIKAVQQAGRNVVWACDPMHGNTTTTGAGLKTRDFDRIIAELNAAFDLHESAGSILGGVHFEMTGEDVTECTGGAQGLSEADLSRNYATYCDPRLNSSQGLEMAFLLARRLRQRRD
ncbi:MAG: 3-deoxy-7-phosphoheptulonate synthase class II [Verrucomicrobiota bacterium]|nr:3-deoxy-7-phosphoheptulonate synthase class II [Verrucomicrobiota bacterium]